MKKLIALALSLALVFAIAAPAMAAWGPAADATAAGYEIVSLNKLVAGKDVIGRDVFSLAPANTAVVAGTPIIVELVVKVPAGANLDADNPDATGFSWQDATIEFDNAIPYKAIYQAKVGSNAWTAFEDADYSRDYQSASITAEPNASYATLYRLIAYAYTVETAKVVASASAGFSAKSVKWANKDTNDDGKIDIYATESNAMDVNGLEIKLQRDLDAEGAPKNNKSATVENLKGHVLTFGLETAVAGKIGMINTWTLNVKDVGVYTVNVTNGKIVFEVVSGESITQTTTGLEASDAAYAKVKGIYDGFVKSLGFARGDVVYFTAANIKANYGYAKTVEASVEYPPYNANLVVTDETQVPNTGDSVSLVGFVLVGLALVAAGAVVVKKVRA